MIMFIYDIYVDLYWYDEGVHQTLHIHHGHEEVHHALLIYH